MKITKVFSIAFFVGSIFIGQSALAQKSAMKKSDNMSQMNTIVGGAEMYPTKTIVENAVNSKDHTTLVAAVKAADLVDVLSSVGPFTVFAPTNDAFDKLPKGTVADLLQPENKRFLQLVLEYHVVAGVLNANDLMKLIKEGRGKAIIETVSGSRLTASMQGNDILLTDENNNTAKVTISNVAQSNGIIHVVDGVLLPLTPQ